MSSAIATDLRVNPFLHIDAERIYLIAKSEGGDEFLVAARYSFPAHLP